MAKHSDNSNAVWGICHTHPAKYSPLIPLVDPHPAALGENQIWQPSPRLVDDVPRDSPFGVILSTQVLSDGTRCFLPEPSFSKFISHAQAAGLAILTHEKNLEPDERNSYRFDWFLYQFARRMHPFIRRGLRSKRDLLVARSAQSTKGERDILPWPKSKIGGQGKRLPATVEELMAIGAERASRDGIQDATAEQCIQCGLIVVAEKMPPISPSKKEIQALFRAVLFDVSSSAAIPPKKQIAIVRERLGRALGNHLDDATMELFNDWLWGPHSSVIKQLAKQRKATGGELDRDEVRHAIVELGWQAHASVAKSVEALMIDFRRAIRPRLNRVETKMFNRLYTRQKCFGGLSLIMLTERLEFIGSHLWKLLQHPPDQNQLSIFYRLLSFYAAMIDNRRAADKRSKERLRSDKPTKQLHDNIQPAKQSSSKKSDRLDYIAEQVCKAQRIQCDCAKPDWKMGTINFVEGVVDAIVGCRNKGCGFVARIKFSAAEYRGQISLE